MIPQITLVYAVLAITLLVNPIAGQEQSSARSTKAPSKLEPFRSFAILDSKLSVLTNQQASLQGALNGNGAGLSSQTRAKLLSNMRLTTAQIGRVAAHLQSRYARQHRPFGVHILRVLRSRANAVNHEIYFIKMAPSISDARIANERLGKRVIALVLQFQAVSGGYATTQCAAREWTCCEPKLAKDLMPGEEAACKWMCLPSANRCTGLLGPRIVRDVR
jgi:hypothetical protein